MNVAIYCGSSLGNNKIYEESTKLLAKKFRKKLCEGELWRKGGCLRNMIIPTKGRKV